MTLIEAMAAIALLATLLSAVLLARGRYVHQCAVTGRRLEATSLADELMSEFHQAGAVPRSGSGQRSFASSGTMEWRTSELKSADAEPLGVSVVRLEVFTPGDGVLARVDVFAPLDSSPRAGAQ